MSNLTVHVHESVDELSQADWAALQSVDNPFVGYSFLSALEKGGALTHQAGWIPRYLAARNETGEVVGFVPLFLKTHSYGEYFFDQAWAHPMQRDGLGYYPKVTVAIPFTPATGQRVWIRADEARSELGPEMMKASLMVANQLEASSVHWLFCTEEEQNWLQGVGFLPRMGLQFHWTNEGYIDFDDMLGKMTRKRRKETRRERRKAQSHGLNIRVVPGTDLTERDWSALYSFYRQTTAAHHAIPYLPEEVFHQLKEHYAHGVVCSMAYADDEPVAGTLNFRRGSHLYGRYWGAVREYDCLHFELCYYALQEWAIQQGLTRFEAGAQGYHKLSRGFLPNITRAAVYVFHSGYQHALKDFLAEEAAEVKERVAQLHSHSPFVSRD